MQQAAQMQEQMQRMQQEAANETAEASVGGGMVKVTANGAGEVLSITISPEAIDPSDPEALGDLVLAGVNEALRSASAAVEAKAQALMGELGLGDLGRPPLRGAGPGARPSEPRGPNRAARALVAESPRASRGRGHVSETNTGWGARQGSRLHQTSP